MLYNQAVPITILAAKLYSPPPSPRAISRARLFERLNEGLHRKLTLIAAPAGFGKSTLVSAWVASSGRRVAWLSLDAADSDPARFLTYLVAAIRKVVPDFAASVWGLLQDAPPAPDAILPTLLNEIATIPENMILALDDYHLIESPAVDEMLAFLIERQPPQMHVVIASREDPRLPLARLRARDQLTELRAADLRFSPAEAAGFLQAMNLALPPGAVAALEERTEGWIAGLQLAALSLQGRQDSAGFIQAFTGDHRYIMDYLVEEVLQQQPAPVRNFLLQTAILDRLTAPLCAAITGQPDTQARLEALERGNYFTIPLDDQRRWYRYHHLFAEVLQAQLRAEQPGLVPELQRRASAWYEANGWPAEAIRHALAAGDFDHAAELIERAVAWVRSSRQEATLRGWLAASPEPVIRARPVLSASYAWVLLALGELEGVEARLDDAARWVDMSPEQTAAAGMIVVEAEQWFILPGVIALYRAAYAQARGDVQGTISYARRVLDIVPAEVYLLRGAAAALLGLATWASGDLEAAYQVYLDGMAMLQRAGNISDAIGCAIALADISRAQGRLHEAERTYQQALQLAREHGDLALRGTADMHVGMSELYREHNDLVAARQHLQRSKDLGEHSGLPQNAYRWCVAMARIGEAEGDLEGALELLKQAERLYRGDLFPNVRPVAAVAARVLIRQGKLAEAQTWARERGLAADDDPGYLREFEHITLARLLLASYRRDKDERQLQAATGLLDRLLAAAEAGGRAGSVIEIRLLRALAYQAQGDNAAALDALEPALALAAPEGYVRSFADERPSMAALLQEYARGGRDSDYVRQLIAACGGEDSSTPLKQPLIEPLSERELQVLRLLNSERSGPEIAHELMVSPNTFNSHTKSIYAKLGVNNRRAAIRRAAELNLFSPQ